MSTQLSHEYTLRFPLPSGYNKRGLAHLNKIPQIATLFWPGSGPHPALVEYGSGPHAAWNDGTCVAHYCLPDLGQKQAIAMPHVSQEQINKPELSHKICVY